MIPAIALGLAIGALIFAFLFLWIVLRLLRESEARSVKRFAALSRRLGKIEPLRLDDPLARVFGRYEADAVLVRRLDAAAAAEEKSTPR
mgnify:CR=1 FL=1